MTTINSDARFLYKIKRKKTKAKKQVMSIIRRFTTKEKTKVHGSVAFIASLAANTN
jgi:hypothetical protein